MEVRNSFQNLSIARQKNPAFKGIAYSPRLYTHTAELTDEIYKHSKGLQKVMLYLQKHKGEMLNNSVTAFGTTFVAPFFIAFNPVSKEDKNSKYYTALRQPISAGVTFGSQYYLVGAFNRWCERLAIKHNINELDLRACPPDALLKPMVKQNYKLYKADCISKGVIPEKKSAWIEAEVKKHKYNAFYDEVNRLREDKEFLNSIEDKSLIKSSDVCSQKDKIFKDYLIKNHGFSEAELADVKDFGALSKKKKLLKLHKTDFETVSEAVTEIAEKNEIKRVMAKIHSETSVKLRVSRIHRIMCNNVEANDIKFMQEHKEKISKAESDLTKAISESKRAAKAASMNPDDTNLKIVAEVKQKAKAEAEKLLTELKTNGSKMFKENSAKSEAEIFAKTVDKLKNKYNELEAKYGAICKKFKDQIEKGTISEKDLKNIEKIDVQRHYSKYVFEKI